MTRLLILTIALAISGAAAVELDPATEKFFRDAELENMKILVKEKDPDWRAKAATSLGGSKYPDANAALGAALSDVDPRVRAAAADALWKSAKNAEPARGQLQRALDDRAAEVAIRAAGALQVLGVPAAELAPARKRVLDVPGAASDARFLAARGLIGIEPPARLLPPMLVYLDEWASPPRASGRSDAARNNVELCAKALAALASTGDRVLIEPLVAEVRRARHGHVVLLKTLSRFTPKPAGWTELLLGQLAAADHNVPYEALSLLGQEKNEAEIRAWVPPVALMLRDANASVRAQALWTLGHARGLAAGHIDTVVGALIDPDVSVRRQAVRAIGEIGDRTQAVTTAAKTNVAERARPALSMAIEKDSDADVRSEAKSVLAKLHDSSNAVAAPADAVEEAGGMALLRSRNITFEEGSFFRALTEADVPVIRAFLDAGMSPTSPVAGVGPPLRAALFAGSACAAGERLTKAETKAMIRLLLDRGADPNLGDARGNTALMEAAAKGCDRDVMKILLAAGAKVNATNAAGLSAFEMGLYAGHDGLEELIAAGYRLTPEKAKAYEQGYAGKPAVQALIRKAARR